MPQLSIETFVSQYFWLIVFLFGFYYFCFIEVIPKFSEILKTRAKIESLGASSEDSAKNAENPTMVKGVNFLINELSAMNTKGSIINIAQDHSSYFANSNKTWATSIK